MYYRILIDGAGYTAGDILDLNDAEEAARIAALVPLVQIPAPLRFPVERVGVPLPQPELRGAAMSKPKRVRV
jgi:hypothetical protein